MRLNRYSGWHGLGLANLLLAVVLWIGAFTNYSLANNGADLLFAPAVALVAMLTLLLIAARGPAGAARRFTTALCLPGLVSGLFPVVVTIVTSPFFLLGFLFAFAEMQDESLIQRAVSPDGRHVAEVYFRPVGAYAGGNGRIFVRVKNRLVPWVEKDVYYLGRSHAGPETNDYVAWLADRTLFVSEAQQEVKTSPVRFRLPMEMQMLRILFGMLWRSLTAAPP